MEVIKTTQVAVDHVQESELEAGVADAVINVDGWMRLLLESASAANCKARVIMFQLGGLDQNSFASDLSDENFFRFREGVANPVFYSTLAEFSWMIPSDKIVMPHTLEEEWNACCIALSSYFALEIRTSTIYPISAELNAQPLDVVLIAGEKCTSAGRLELQVEGKFDKIVYRSLGNLGARSIVLPPHVLLRNCLPRLGNDVIQVILQFVGSPFAHSPTISIATTDNLVVYYEDDYGCSGRADYGIIYNKDILGAQTLSVSSNFTSQSMYDSICDIDKYECSWYGNGRHAIVGKTQLHSEQRPADSYYEEDFMYYQY